MKKITLEQQVSSSFVTAKERMESLSVAQKNQIEKSWDIEHAYYSSALEGSKIDRKEFEKLGEEVA